MRDWQRLGFLVVLAPVLWIQGKHVRKVTPRLPEPDGERAGEMGQGPTLRLLLTGDSAAAGVGASSQALALSGQLVGRLAQHYTVRWQLVAQSGLDSSGMLDLFKTMPVEKFDVVVLSIGVNDVTALMAPSNWKQWQSRLANAIKTQFDPVLLVHSAVPPMEQFTAMPQPLRWLMGAWAAEMNRQLLEVIGNHPDSLVHAPFVSREPGGLADDGFHPGPLAYQVWAESLSKEIVEKFGSGLVAH